MALIRQSLTATTLRNLSPARDAGLVTRQRQWTSTASDTETYETVGSVVYRKLTDSTGYFEYIWQSSQPVQYVSSDTSVLTVSATGVISRVASEAVLTPQIAYVDMLFPSGMKVRKRFDVSVKEVGVVREPASWATGSLGKHVTDATLALIDGVTASTATKKIYDTDNRLPSARNPDCWAASIDLTGHSYNHIRGGTAITARHVVAASHYPLSVGTVLRWMTADDTVVERTITGIAKYDSTDSIVNTTTGGWSLAKDWQVCTLSEALPSSVTPFKIAGTPLLMQISGLTLGIPLLCLDQQDHATIREWYSVIGSWAYHRAPTPPSLAAFQETLISGDSGDPAFLIANGEAVLMGCHTGANQYHPYASDITALYALIDSADAHAGISTGLRPTLADFSSFIDFQ